MATIAERIQALVTPENAKAWNDSTEAYLFCDDLLASADIDPTEGRILKLERMFEYLLVYMRDNRLTV